MADSRSKLTLSRVYSHGGKRRRPPKPDAWIGSDDYRAKYTAKRAEAQARANELGMDHGIECRPTFKEWAHFLLPQKQYRQGHETLCEVVHPENVERTQRGHGYSATRPPSTVGPDYHGGPWVGHVRAVELSRAWWAQWDHESRWLGVVRAMRLLRPALRWAATYGRLR